MFLIFRINNGLKEYLTNENKKLKFNSIVKAKQYLAEYLKLTDYDMNIQSINFEEIGDDRNVDK